jgi:hypothetical protein
MPQTHFALVRLQEKYDVQHNGRRVKSDGLDVTLSLFEEKDKSFTATLH